MSKGARWQTVALGWIAAVVVTMLIAAWAISIVGHQLSSAVTLPKSATSNSSQAPAPSTTPRPRPSANLTHRGQRNGPGSVAAAPGVGVSATGVTSGPQAGAGTGTGAADDGGSGTGEPARRPPATSPPPATRPPSLVSDQRAVKTDGGTAAFTCTNTDAMSLLYATSAPGYTSDPPRIRSTSRIEVDFSGDPLDQKIDARCDGGKVTYTIEH